MKDNANREHETIEVSRAFCQKALRQSSKRLKRAIILKNILLILTILFSLYLLGSTLQDLDSADSKWIHFNLLLVALLTQISLNAVNMQTGAIVRFLKDAGLYQKDKKKDSKESDGE